jgi:hypothetical protein
LTSTIANLQLILESVLMYFRMSVPTISSVQSTPVFRSLFRTSVVIRGLTVQHPDTEGGSEKLMSLQLPLPASDLER